MSETSFVKDGYQYCTNHSLDGYNTTYAYPEEERAKHEGEGWFVVKQMIIGEKHYRLWRKKLD